MPDPFCFVAAFLFPLFTPTCSRRLSFPGPSLLEPFQPLPSVLLLSRP